MSRWQADLAWEASPTAAVGCAPRTRMRFRHPKRWNWTRIAGFTLVPSLYVYAVFHAIGPTP
jgi:hypothetical protein